MTMDNNEITIGFDLGSDFSVLTYYRKNETEPVTVSTVPGEKRYSIPTPRSLFSMVEQGSGQAVATLSNFFKVCVEKIPSEGQICPDGMFVMVTVKEMSKAWVKTIRQALEQLGISRNRIYLQDHKESFAFYAMNQKIDLRKKKVALFAYEQEFIYGYELAADHRTKPALVTVRKRGRVCLDAKTRGTRKPEHWKRMKNLRFLDYAKKIVGEENFGAAYLSGDELNDKCYDETRNYLCNHAKKVLYGVELYAEGACYSAMHYAGWNVNRDLLYTGEDMLAYNVSMDMLLKGKEERVVLIHAGCSYYMAYRSCEFIPDGTDRILIYSTDLYGKEKSHEIELDGLPKRPNRATRIRMELTFQSQELCKVRLEDLGFGELFESSGKVWETVIRM